MDDKPTGRVADVERLLQVLAVLRDADGWVSRRKLHECVHDYGTYDWSSEALHRLFQRDLEALRDLGFHIESDTHSGDVARDRLTTAAWRVPLDLDAEERRLLAWVMVAAGASGDPAPEWSGAPRMSSAGRLNSLLGSVPGALDLVHRALADGRRLRIHRNGRDQEIDPAQLFVQQGRWFLIARYVDSDRFYGFRLDRLDVTGLGDEMKETPFVRDPLEVTDPTAWPMHDPVDVELRCPRDDAERVHEWFARGELSHDGDEAVIRMSVRNTASLVDRVLSFAGGVRVASPPSVVAAVREHVLAVVSAP
jgi:predicted DNA-binding transcriptional regulator YafY